MILLSRLSLPNEGSTSSSRIKTLTGQTSWSRVRKSFHFFLPSSPVFRFLGL